MPQTIKPATPLPWSASDYHEMGGYDCMTGSITVGRAELDGNRYGQIACEQITAEQLAAITQDAAYIVEAANAYPRLMAENESMRKSLHLISADRDSLNAERAELVAALYRCVELGALSCVYPRSAGRRRDLEVVLDATASLLRSLGGE